MTGSVSAIIMSLSGISEHGARDLLSQRGSTIKLLWACTVTSQYSSRCELRCCQAIEIKERITIQRDSRLFVIGVFPLRIHEVIPFTQPSDRLF